MSTDQQWDGIPDPGTVVDWAIPICCDCGGPRSPNSGKVCRSCYRQRAADKREKNAEYIILSEMQDGERKGHFVLTPQGWTLPHYVKFIDWSQE